MRLVAAVSAGGTAFSEGSKIPRTKEFSTMHVLITELIASGNCELTGKTDVECVRVRLDESSQEMLVRPAELLKLLRFKRRQEPATAPKSPDKKGTPS